jgi:diguanylate cyclase (GGDEF)-like protein
VSACIAALRQSDTVARLGGDEFVILLPDTDKNKLSETLPRLLSVISAASWNRSRITFSVGALTCNQSPSSVEETIMLADKLMYKVKRAGKNSIQYSVYPPSI